MKPIHQPEILQRLRCAAGHLNAVIEMAEADRPCETVLHQLNAVQAALRAAAIRLILCETEQSKSVILNSPSSQQRISELERIQSLYTLFVQYSNHHNEVSHE